MLPFRAMLLLTPEAGRGVILENWGRPSGGTDFPVDPKKRTRMARSKDCTREVIVNSLKIISDKTQMSQGLGNLVISPSSANDV